MSRFSFVLFKQLEVAYVILLYESLWRYVKTLHAEKNNPQKI